MEHTEIPFMTLHKLLSIVYQYGCKSQLPDKVKV
jgi:hypothetical protein